MTAGSGTTDYRSYARSRAKKYNLDPNVFEAQINQESGFDPGVTSGAGAQGIAQIMPDTAKAWGVNANDPLAALDSAARHMSDYVKQYGGIRNALIAYNAGPGKVGSSSLPSETTNYIKTILGAAGHLGSSPSPNVTNVSSIASTPGGTPGMSLAVPKAQPTLFDTLNQFRQATTPPAPIKVGEPQNQKDPSDPYGMKAYAAQNAAQITKMQQTTQAILDSQKAASDAAQAASPVGSGVLSDVGAAATNVATGKGTVKVAPGANRAGVTLQKPIMSFLDGLSASMGRAVDITTGTNHNQYVAGSNNESDHWTGNASDLGVGGDARQDKSAGSKGDLIAAHAISNAGGIPFAKALSMARQGGLWNFNTQLGRVQIIWRSMTGGNHYNHVHIGVR